MNIRTLAAFAAVAAAATFAACGGGSHAVMPTATKSATSTVVGNARANVTIRYPQHIAYTKRRSSAAKRGAQFVDPGDGSTPAPYLEIQVNNGGAYYYVTDPSTSSSQFTLPAPNSDGSATLSLPIVAGTYTPDSIYVDERDGEGDLLADGYNQEYIDGNGVTQTGQFTIMPGSTGSFVVTLSMIVDHIVVTTDPINGSDASPLPTTNPGTYSPFQIFAGCGSTTVPLYFFSADEAGGFALPSSAKGYVGNDAGYVGVPVPSISGQAVTNTQMSSIRIQPSALGGSSYTLTTSGPGATDNVDVNVYDQVHGTGVYGSVGFNTYGGC